MVDEVPILAAALPEADLSVARPTLTVVLPTAMLLVDYAMRGKTTPTPEPQTVVQAISPTLAEATEPLRAALAHGAALRSYLARYVPADHRGHLDWRSLRRWIARLDDERIAQLIDDGVQANIAYDGTTPDANRTMRVRRRDARLVLSGWGVPATRAAELFDVAEVRRLLLELLDVVWADWLAEAWKSELPALQAIAAPTPPPGCTGTQWLTLVTGLRPDPEYARAADQATALHVMPCPGLGRSFSLFPLYGGTGVLFSPQSAAVERGQGVALGALARLTSTVDALGDRTRLAILLRLAQDGPLSMQQLSAALKVHQSTVSRQIAVLRKAGLVRLDDQRQIEIARDVVRKTCDTLREALG